MAPIPRHCEDAVTTVTIQVEASPDGLGGQHWHEFSDFLDAERRFRDSRTPEECENMVFLSHCWRKHETQAKKRRIVAYLSHPPPAGPSKPADNPRRGLVYWSDFLDLQAQGPVPWKEEISRGIAACSKFVAFIDEAFLTSYNCLQELAIAFSCHKPVVPIVLDQEAWDLLTTPGGAARAKASADGAMQDGGGRPPAEEEDSAAKAYNATAHGAPLVKFEGEEVVAGEAMSLEAVRKLFSRLGAINLCPCHDQQVREKGVGAVLEMCSSYVRQELQYTKEHAELTLMANKGATLSGREAQAWSEWLGAARANLRDPYPTEQQETYVRRARAKAGRRRAALRGLAVAVVVVLFGAALSSGLLAVKATRHARLAEARRLEAEEHAAEDRRRRAEALAARAEAQMQRDEAERRRRDVEIMLRLSEKLAKVLELLAEGKWKAADSQGDDLTTAAELSEALSPLYTEQGWRWINIPTMDLAKNGLSGKEFAPFLSVLAPRQDGVSSGPPTPNGAPEPLHGSSGAWAFNPMLSSLDLEGNRIGDEGAMALAAALEPRQNPGGTWVYNKALRTLNLRGNGIGDAGAEALAAALEPRQTPSGAWVFTGAVNKLDLRDNNIADKGWRALVASFQPRMEPNSHELVYPSLSPLNISGIAAWGGDSKAHAIARYLLSPRQRPDGTWVFSTALRELDLAWTWMRAEGAAALAAALEPRRNPDGSWVFNGALNNLDLFANAVGAEGAKAIAAALEPRQNPDGTWVFNGALRSLNINNNGIGAEGAQAITAALEPRQNPDGTWVCNKALKKLGLWQNSIGVEGTEALPGALEPRQNPDGTWVFNEALGSLDLSYSFVGALRASALASALEPRRNRDGTWTFNAALSSLDLRGNSVGPEGAEALAAALEPRQNPDGSWVFNEALKYLDLSGGNAISDAGAMALAQALEPRQNPDGNWVFNPALSTLELRSNNIGDEGAKALAAALDPRQNPDSTWSYNTALSELNLSNNNISHEGWDAVGVALQPKANPDGSMVNSPLTGTGSAVNREPGAIQGKFIRPGVRGFPSNWEIPQPSLPPTSNK